MRLTKVSAIWETVRFLFLILVIPVKLVLTFTRCSANTPKCEGGERESIFLVIPDIVYRESIWGLYRWIPATDTKV
jgi:hypothetical protein